MVAADGHLFDLISYHTPPQDRFGQVGELMKFLLKWALIIVVGITVLGKIGDAFKRPEETAAEKAAREDLQYVQAQAKYYADLKAVSDMPLITAQTLASAYEANTVAADARFKGKRFKISGTVASINTDFTGDPYVTLRGGVNQFMEPQFGFDKSESGQLAALTKGSNVTLVCTGRGDIAKTPMSKDCKMQ